MKRVVIFAMLLVSVIAWASFCYSDVPADGENTENCAVSVVVTADSPVFTYTAGTPYKANVSISNSGNTILNLNKISVNWKNDGVSNQLNPQTALQESIAPGKTVALTYPVTFPNETAGKTVPLLAEVNYSIDGKPYTAKADTSVFVAPLYEITLLPGRSILSSMSDLQRIGISIINHSSKAYTGKVKLTATSGLKVMPDSFDVKIDPQGLDAYVFGVQPEKKLAPGHYAVYINLDDKTKDWAAVDVPAFAKKTSQKDKSVDWKNAETVSIKKLVSIENGKGIYENKGEAKFAYDDSNLYLAFEINWAKSITVAFDTLINGAKSPSGGYKNDDYEYTFSDVDGKNVVQRTAEPSGKPLGEISTVLFKRTADSGKDTYEIAIPWSDLAPFKPKKNAMFALSVLVNNTDGTYFEWGGGLAGKVDPRMFIPLVLSE